MADITQADREAAHELLRAFYGREAHIDNVAGHLRRHRIAALDEAIAAVRSFKHPHGPPLTLDRAKLDFIAAIEALKGGV